MTQLACFIAGILGGLLVGEIVYLFCKKDKVYIGHCTRRDVPCEEMNKRTTWRVPKRDSTPPVL